MWAFPAWLLYLSSCKEETSSVREGGILNVFLGAQPCRAQLFVTLWTVTCQVSLSVDFADKDTIVGCHFFLQGIFLTLGSRDRMHVCISSLAGATWGVPESYITSPSYQRNIPSQLFSTLKRSNLYTKIWKAEVEITGVPLDSVCHIISTFPAARNTLNTAYISNCFIYGNI